MSLGIKNAVRNISKEVAAHSLFLGSNVFSVYPYMYSPAQLMFIAQKAKEQCHLGGTFLEIGCARGATTTFVNKYIEPDWPRQRYIALDTFSGFPKEQVDFEVSTRGKPSTISRAFTDNKKEWVQRSLDLANIRNVELVQMDATKFDYDSVGGVTWALLDVDLYLPIRDILPKLYKNLAPGGIIIVDDCMPDERWDGALQAYTEFVNQNGFELNIVHEKLGIIERPAA